MSGCNDREPLQIITSIEGWMTERELRYLCEMAQGKHVLEIGILLGRSTINMLRYAKSLVAIDHFKGNPKDVASDLVAKIEQGGSTLWQQFLHRLAEHNIGDTEFILMKMDSKVAHNLLCSARSRFFDFVFVDGNHEYNDVYSDIVLYRDFVREGGILAGHDYYTDGNFPDVCKAVDEIFGKPDEVVETIWVKRM